MPVCIYCQEPTTGGEGAAHVLPEAVVANQLTLRRGMVCDGCNNYLGRLDNALANHPLVAFGIQVFGVPGKKRKPRAEIGHFSRTGDERGATVTLPSRRVKDLHRDSDNRVLVALQPPTNEDRQLFHRALHHVAFNLVAFYGQAGDVLSASFDAARRYIRAPLKGDVWPYYHTIVYPKPVDIIDLLFLCEPPTPQVVLRIFNHAFAVDLTCSPDFGELLHEQSSPGVSWTKDFVSTCGQSPNPTSRKLHNHQ